MHTNANCKFTLLALITLESMPLLRVKNSKEGLRAITPKQLIQISKSQSKTFRKFLTYCNN